MPKAMSHGSFFFADIEQNQVNEEELAVLRAVAGQGEGGVMSGEELRHRFPDGEELERSLDLLERRELIEQVEEGYRFQVELIRRWFSGVV